MNQLVRSPDLLFMEHVSGDHPFEDHPRTVGRPGRGRKRDKTTVVEDIAAEVVEASTESLHSNITPLICLTPLSDISGVTF
ncbi:hypothetical protein TNCV_4998251 [Trichonephila clavipes]|nr:hypothetical protein TNCV_4998251 [Trichonephila clavipes]